MNAYNLIRAMITTGGYKLAEIQAKIKRMFLLGDLTEAQLDELMQLAAHGASHDAERPETLALIHSLADRIAAAEARLDALENGSETGGAEMPEGPAYPEWVPWDGISSNYQPGAIVAHGGKLWESIFSGQNVWEPGVIGSESLWVEWAEAEPGSEVEEDAPDSAPQ